MFAKNKRLTVLYLFLILIAALSACASQPAFEAEAPAGEPAFGGDFAPAAPMEDGAGGRSSLPSNAAQVERIVIKNANVSISVPDPAESADRITRMAEEMGGYVVSAQVYKTELDSGVEVSRASVTIRVPADLLNDALDRITTESEREPIRREITSEDVTTEYTDLESRLRNLENTEERLNQIMDEATDTEDVLNVYNRLVEVREDIEVIKGRIQYYDQAAALSAISVSLIPDEAVQPLTIGRWEIGGTAKNAVEALLNVLELLVYAAIWIFIVGLPVLLLLYLVFVLPLRLALRWWRRRSGRAQKASPPSAD